MEEKNHVGDEVVLNMVEVSYVGDKATMVAENYDVENQEVVLNMKGATYVCDEMVTVVEVIVVDDTTVVVVTCSDGEKVAMELVVMKVTCGDGVGEEVEGNVHRARKDTLF